MRNNIKKATIFISIILLSACSDSVNKNESKDPCGYQNIKWGASIDETVSALGVMQLLNKRDKKQEYIQKNVNEVIVERKFIFVDGGLYEVELILNKNMAHGSNYKNKLESIYGERYEITTNDMYGCLGTNYKWVFSTTSIIYNNEIGAGIHCGRNTITYTDLVKSNKIDNDIMMKNQQIISEDSRMINQGAKF